MPKGKGEKSIRGNVKTVRIQRPQNINPWARNADSKENGTVWIHMKPFRIIDQFSKSQGTIQRVGTPDAEYVFIAPTSLQENYVHTWSPYESVASRLAQKVKSTAQTAAEINALRNIFGKEANLADRIGKTLTTKKQTTDVAGFVAGVTKEAYRAVPGSLIPKIKIDTPLYYENSERRQLVLDFKLVAEQNPYYDLIEPIQDMMKQSSPDLVDDITIEFPYMWEIYTSPTEFIRYETCALVGVQPTWNSPYIAGYPSSVELQLTFMDLSPLYRKTITDGTVIRVIDKTQSDAAQARGNSTQNNHELIKEAAKGSTYARTKLIAQDSENWKIKQKMRQ